MITIEATHNKKKIDQLCLTDPHDGGSRDRNAKKTKEWKKKHPKGTDYAFYLD